MRVGNKGDGGWNMCIVPPYRPVQPCLIYSFGINNDFSFDDDASAQFKCTVRSLDPSMSASEHKRSDNVWFYKIGLSGHDHVNERGWKMMTLDSVMKHFNESTTIIEYLKFDIEYSEWAVIEEMHKSGVLSRVKQLALEVHMGQAPAAQLSMRSAAEHENYYRILSLLEKDGMRRWHYKLNYVFMRSTPNGQRSCCYEMAYINQKFMEKE